MPANHIDTATMQKVAPLYERVKTVIPEIEWPVHAPYIAAINKLKKEKNAVILAHNYMTPEIFHCVADITGDSLALAQKAADTDADVIVQAGVHFMAETAKLMNPDKTVLMPDLDAGCSLAESITAADVRKLRDQHPGVPVVTYVNTSAEVKAECDICCTSGNALAIVESLGEIITWEGRCEVHERFTGDEIEAFRRGHENLTIIAHPECPPDVLHKSDFVGSTAQMQDYVLNERPEKVLMVTECSMSDNVSAGVHDVEFIRPCNLCPHMKKITLANIQAALETLSPAVEIDPAIADRARLSVERMLDVGRSKMTEVAA
jgi:quinolinate synthase